ncbi:MAG TPA: SUMF1/EgtB/PvdO family nonheme iron enzyme [Kofleriaceae bacterium]|nr:SUMF1/EgtB/PvdO family nonheme iron enzyme [Kofleriaceae bacterium]
MANTRAYVWLCTLAALGCGGGTGLPDAATRSDTTTSDVTINDSSPDAGGAACGPTGTSPCSESTAVPGGTFYRSYDLAADGLFSNMSYPATVSGFRLDKYEVTVGRFRQFALAGMGTQSSPPAAGGGSRSLNGMSDQGGWDPAWNTNLPINTAALTAAVKCGGGSTWTDSAGANETLPIDCISWFEAMAFCIWDGGFLPTDAEWNYAAAGGDEQRAYPWSNPNSSVTIDCTHANYAGGCAGALNRVGSESPAGDGKWGHSDLAGNIMEWTLDWYTSPYPTPCDNCAQLTQASDNRVLRGGAYLESAMLVRAGVRRGGFTPFDRFPYIGVRCARAP